MKEKSISIEKFKQITAINMQVLIREFRTAVLDREELIMRLREEIARLEKIITTLSVPKVRK